MNEIQTIDPLHQWLVKLLIGSTTEWQYTVTDAPDAYERALVHLTVAGLLQQEGRLDIRMRGSTTSLAAHIHATGNIEKALPAKTIELVANVHDWFDGFGKLRGQLAPTYGFRRARLTRDGELAKTDLTNPDRFSDAFNWICSDKMVEGEITVREIRVEKETKENGGNGPTVINAANATASIGDVNVKNQNLIQIDTTAIAEAMLQMLKTEDPAKSKSADRFANDCTLRVTDVADRLGINKGEVSRLVGSGDLADNGKQGHDRRISESSVAGYQHKQKRRAEEIEQAEARAREETIEAMKDRNSTRNNGATLRNKEKRRDF